MIAAATHRWRRRAGGSFLAAAALIGLAACDESLVEAPLVDESASPRVVAVTGPALVAQFGVFLDTPLRVRVFDAAGLPIRSATVKYAVVSGAGIFSADSTLTNDQGFTEVTFRPFTTGTVIVEARSEGTTGTGRVQFTILVLADPNEGASFEELSGDGQTAPAGSFVPDPLVVRVENADGFPVDSHPVTFTIQQAQGDSAGVATSRGGSASGQITVLTDAAGTARAFLRLGTRSGAHAVVAQTNLGPAGAGSSETLSFTATATPLPAARLVVIAGNGQTAVIDTIHMEGSPDFKGRDPNPFVVQAVDRFGTPVAGVAVQWRVSDGGGELEADVTPTDASGIAENRLTEPTEGRNAVVAFASDTNVVEFLVTAEVFEPPVTDEGDGGGG